MNICLINYEFPPLGGGAGNATKKLAEEFAKKGHAVNVLTTWFPGLAETEVVDFYTVHRVQSRRKKRESSNPLEMLSFCWHAVRYLRKEAGGKHIDKIIAFFAIPSGLIAYYFKYSRGIKYIVSLRGGDVPGFLPQELRFYHFLTKRIIYSIWRNADLVVANSIGLKALAQKCIDPDVVPIQMIPNGVDHTVFKPRNKNENAKCKIIVAGRLRPQKQVDKIIAILPKIIKDTKKIFLTIVGDGPLRPQLELMVRNLGITEYVRFMGWVYQENIAQMYQESDVFVLPSLDEGMSNVILEAMASGLPIITSRIPSNLELVDNNVNGIVVDSNEELIAALLRLIVNKGLREAMGKASLKKSKNYRWSAVADQYLSYLT